MGRAVTMVVAGIAVLAAVLMSFGVIGNKGAKRTERAESGSEKIKQSADKPAKGATQISLVVSSEKEKFLTPLVAKFNDEGHTAGGHPVFVRMKTVASGDAARQIAQGKLKPTVWSPASSLWGQLVNFQADAKYVPSQNPSIVRTPLVIAMWEPMATVLGWPNKQIGFEDILRLSSDPKGWAAVGKPQFGRFKLGHTDPTVSTSGLSAVVAEYYAATGKREGLIESDLSKPKVVEEVRDTEQSIVHYGDTTLFFAEQLKKYGTSYASAVLMEETTMIDFNKGRQGEKLVAIYPKEGTFFSDNPYIVLDAPWVTPEQKQAADEFGKYVAKKVTPQVAGQYGFRPADANAKPVSPVDVEHGAILKQPQRVLGLPEPKVLAGILNNWKDVRKPANVMLVVDTSGSMNEGAGGSLTKMDAAKRGLTQFFKQISPRDHIGITSFNGQIFPLVGISEYATNRERLQSAVQQMIADGETAVYDATWEGVTAVQKLNDDDRINAVVVLTDGEDTKSHQFPQPQPLIQRLTDQAKGEGRQVRVYTIAYGDKVNPETLNQIAAASGGKGFTAAGSDIEAIYKQISTFF